MSAAFDPFAVLAELRDATGSASPREPPPAPAPDRPASAAFAASAPPTDAEEPAPALDLRSFLSFRLGTASEANAPVPTALAMDWRTLPYGSPERRQAFADARAIPGACGCCTGVAWWRRTADPAEPLRCGTCHPPVPSMAVT